MFKCNNEETASAIANENKTQYGMSVFDGKWYAGTVEQLKAIGVATVKTPNGNHVLLRF